MKYLMAIVFILLTSNIVSANSHYAHYECRSDNQNFGHYSPDELRPHRIPESDQDPAKIILQQNFRFIDPDSLTWMALKGFSSDGATIPRYAWWFIGTPLSGRYVDEYSTGKMRRDQWDDNQQAYTRYLQ